MGKRWIRLFLTSLLIAILVCSFTGPAFASSDSSQGKMPLEKARQVLEEKLMGLPGIAGIAHSDQTGEIVVLLENDHAKGQVPARFEGFGVRTIITGKIQARPVGTVNPVALNEIFLVSSDRLSVVRPLIGGVSVSAYVAGQRWAGTLGMVTYNNKILSNTHVIALDLNNNYLPAGTPVIQPGGYEGGTLDDQVGLFEKCIPITFSGKTRNYADAAIASIDPGIACQAGWQYSETGDYLVSGSTTVSAGDTVRKSGRTSGITENSVLLTNASVTVDYGSGKRAYFADQIIVNQPFSSSGDSGSMVDKGGEFVGLVFAGSTYYSIVCKASYIIDGLGISVEPTSPPVLQSIAVTPAAASIIVGGTQQFTATGNYSDGSTADLTSTVTWTSSDQAIATVVENTGLATGLTAGTTEISASLNGVTGTSTLTVTTEPTQPTAAVTIIDMSINSRTSGKNTFAWATAPVSVTDNSGGSALDGATVEGRWTAPVASNVSGITNASGQVTFTSSSVKNPVSGTTFTFVVDRVSKNGIVYILSPESISDSINYIKQ